MRPEFDLVQNTCTSSLETAATVTMLILSILCMAKVVKEIRFGCQRESYESVVIENTEKRDPDFWPAEMG